MRRRVLISLFLLLSACKKESVPVAPVVVANAVIPQHIKVQHILIGFKGTMAGKEIARSEAEAEKLATEVFAKAVQAPDFEALVKEFSDDRAPGTYALSDRGVSPEGDEIPREQMSPGFGDLSFSLKVSEVGLVPFDKVKSPLGFHIIKRLE